MDWLTTFHVFNAEVRYTRVADLPLLHQLLHRVPCLFDLLIRIRPVNLVKINYVDLQTLQANQQAITHFRRLLTLAISPKHRREILFWMADSFKAMQEYERAALMYLQSAMYTGPDSMDPWAQTARFNAAESLQKAGLVDDSRRIYQSLLKVTKEPARRSVLRHNIQQLWLTQGAG